MVAPLCRATQPTAVSPEAGTLPIRCGRRQECQRHTALSNGGLWPFPVHDWACDGNRFDQFVPLEPAGINAGG